MPKNKTLFYYLLYYWSLRMTLGSLGQWLSNTASGSASLSESVHDSESDPSHFVCELERICIPCIPQAASSQAKPGQANFTTSTSTRLVQYTASDRRCPQSFISGILTNIWKYYLLIIIDHDWPTRNPTFEKDADYLLRSLEFWNVAAHFGREEGAW